MAIETVKNTTGYKTFNHDRLDEFTVTSPVVKTGDIYKPMFDGACFFSLDLKKANYHVLKFYHPNLVLNTHTYEDFIGQFTEFDYIRKSKYIRQVIFGNLNPKK